MTVIPLFLYVRGVELIGLGPTGMIFYITPTLQFILGYFYYNEDFSILKFGSFIIIWIAVIIYLNDLYEKKLKIFFYFILLFFVTANADENLNFENWKKNFKERALNNGISEKTFNLVMLNTKFLPNVIKYDRYQPEFYEDTKTYIGKKDHLQKKLKKELIFTKKIKI